MEQRNHKYLILFPKHLLLMNLVLPYRMDLLNEIINLTFFQLILFAYLACTVVIIQFSFHTSFHQ